MRVKWDRVEHLGPNTGEVTGVDAEEAEAAKKLADAKMEELRARPLMILVCDELGTCEVAERLEDKVWKDQKVALATKAFRMVRMSPEAASEEALLKGHGKADPRLIFMDLARDKVVVLEGKRVDVRPIYSAMKKISRPFFKEALDGVVKKHVKLLSEYDKIHPRIQQARKRLTAEDNSESSSARKLKKKLETLESEQKKLRDVEASLWKLTPKASKRSPKKS